MPYKSEKQRRLMHAKHPAIAARWDAEYGSKVKKSLNSRAWREAVAYAGPHSNTMLAKQPLRRIAAKRTVLGSKVPVSRKIDQAALVHRTKRGAPAGQPLHRGIYVTRDAHPGMEALKPGSKFNPSRGSVSSWTTDSDVARRRANAEQVGWKPNPKRPQWGDSVHAPPTGRGYEIKLHNARSYRIRNEQTSVPDEKEHLFSGKVRVTHREGNVIHVEPARRRQRVNKSAWNVVHKARVPLSGIPQAAPRAGLFFSGSKAAKGKFVTPKSPMSRYSRDARVRMGGLPKGTEKLAPHEKERLARALWGARESGPYRVSKLDQSDVHVDTTMTTPRKARLRKLKRKIVET